MTRTRFEDLKQRRLDRMTDSERAEFEGLLAEERSLLLAKESAPGHGGLD